MNDSNSDSANRTTWWQAAILVGGSTEAYRRNNRLFTIWSFVLGISVVVVSLVLAHFEQLEGPVAWMLAMIPTILGVATVRSFLRLLREADELVRKIQLEAIAMGFGAGQIFCLGYFTFELVGAPELPMVIAVVPMALGWIVGSLLVAARYR